MVDWGESTYGGWGAPSYIVKKALKQNPTFSPFMPISPCVNEKIYFECAKQVKFHR